MPGFRSFPARDDRCDALQGRVQPYRLSVLTFDPNVYLSLDTESGRNGEANAGEVDKGPVLCAQGEDGPKRTDVVNVGAPMQGSVAANREGG